MQTVLGFREAPFLHRNALVAIVASLEIIRRGLWNFFRFDFIHHFQYVKIKIRKKHNLTL